jgi:CheY-like chemotaxis protein
MAAEGGDVSAPRIASSQAEHHGHDANSHNHDHHHHHANGGHGGHTSQSQAPQIVHKMNSNSSSNVQVLTFGEQSSSTIASVSPHPLSHHNSEDALTNLSLTNMTKPSTKPTLSILIVEDTPSIAKMTTMLLRRKGYTTEVAENGMIGLEKVIASYEALVSSPSQHNRHHQHHSKQLNHSGNSSHIRDNDSQTTGSTVAFSSPRSHQVAHGHPHHVSHAHHAQQSPRLYDVVLMDLQMPVMDGLEATRRIRTYEKTLFEKSGFPSHQLVVGVSANSDYDTMKEAMKVGFDDFIPKPFSIDTFNRTVEKYRSEYAITTPPPHS